MSMHMIRGVQVHGNSKRKSKKKLDMKKLEVEWRQYNKRMRQTNCHAAQFETLNDYVQYVTGNVKLTKKEFTPYEPKESQPRRTTKNYPSLSTESIPGAGTKKESQVYSGDYIVGIATMHKSNLVPVGRGDDPSNYATMRRN
jgi:hypothetical protein